MSAVEAVKPGPIKPRDRNKSKSSFFISKQTIVDFERRTKNLFWCEFRRNVGLLIRLPLVRAQVREPIK